MKRYFILSILSLSIFILLVMTVIPHHHHEGIACVITELCEDDDTYNDEHTYHKDISGQNTYDYSCITELDIIVPSLDHEMIFKILSAKDNLNLFFLLPTHLNVLVDSTISDNDFGEYILNYQSAHVNHYNGLRAPPYLPA